MKILAIEFSSSQRAAAVLELGSDGVQRGMGECVDTEPRSTRALGLVEEALREAGVAREAIEVIAVGLGPGSYTGIRSGLALAQGWGLGREVRVLGISSVDVLAEVAREQGLRGPIELAIDAQRKEFYLARYELSAESTRCVEPLKLVSNGELKERARDCALLAGPDLGKWLPQARPLFPSALVLARLAAQRSDYVTAERLVPIYLRETSFVKAPPRRRLPQ